MVKQRPSAPAGASTRMSDEDARSVVKTKPRGLPPVLRWVLLTLVLGFAIYVLLPQVGELGQGLQALRSGRWPFLALSLTGAFGSYVASAWMVRASVDRPIPWARNTAVQISATAASALTPLGVGWVAVTEGFLRKQGVEPATARAATALNMTLTAFSHVVLLMVTIPLLPSLDLPTVSPTQERLFLGVAGALALLTAVLLCIPSIRKRVLEVIKPTLAAVPNVVRHPKRSVLMVSGAVATNCAYALALYGAIAAFGPAAPPLAVLVVYLLAATVAVVAPTPGGLGAMEAALVAALARIAVPSGQAVAAALAFRIFTFWLPLVAGGVLLRIARRRGWVPRQ